MTATAPSTVSSIDRRHRTTAPVGAGGSAALLALTTGVAALGNVAVGFAAPAFGADVRFANLAAAHVVVFTLVGAAVSIGGWYAVVRFVRRSRRALTVTVPALFVLTAIPNVAMMAVLLPLPYAGAAEGAALLLMHVVLVGVLVPVLTWLAPPR